MRELILITAMILASAAAQAGERSLSLGGAQSLPAAASNSVTTAGKVADLPVAPAFGGCCAGGCNDAGTGTGSAAECATVQRAAVIVGAK
ncbi:hypothetical protein ABIB82_006353 [Bradyrhizobium sp. i1.8.4]|uniref:hypothetical protein n=1 Tax=unclassified Bradyrhizobium TaxID=2631580 RepID=UPI003D1F9FC2